ncbi:hypothetical protein MKS88_003063 [Plasmodium brasilianum]|uniref:Uncharacterized protein n=2 Tax=Plasmodium (Plasmodium) TaxID=418103 RepID=A0A1A8VZS6_PLAMA|nr:conserved Plasmodium protein, unknown function [Plasmodium malariae]KAI4838579.1 hypothetical protein MKS88_003063 [Plasmodium brasilianum]SBS86007.1 conserved Plasmodium protein, unknown function [Plasmodium malariae]SCN12989.1 conserved Plasmodium protein, unknown function [Plasmodium malariae]
MKDNKKKKNNKNRQTKCDKTINICNENDDESTNKAKKENRSNVNNIGKNQNNEKNINQKNYLENCSIRSVGTYEDENDKRNVYYIFEELILNKHVNSSIYYYTWFYYFENMILKLDSFLNLILNYSYYLLNNSSTNIKGSKNNKRTILLTQSSPISKLINSSNNKNKFKLGFNNNSFKSIEQIIIHKKEITANNKIDEKEMNIINYLKKKNIKSMIYINDIFEPQRLSMMFLIYSTDEKQCDVFFSEEQRITEQLTNSTPKKLDYNECGILNRYDIILIRHSLEIIYLYKNKNINTICDNHTCNSTDLISSTKPILKKNNPNNGKSNKVEVDSTFQENGTIEKTKYHSMVTWRPYLNNSYLLKYNIVLDALSVCSGMDGYIDDKNFNFDVLINDEYSYLIQYKTKLSICRLVYAVTSLLKKKMKPIIYIPYWWYHDIQFCKNNIVESTEFHLYIFNELKKDMLLKIGYKKVDPLMLSMDEKDIDIFIDQAIQNDATLCTNNSDIIKYYLNINERAKVSKFISKGTFFVLTNHL